MRLEQNRLVRNSVPDLLQAEGIQLGFRRLDDDAEFKSALMRKLWEKLRDYLGNDSSAYPCKPDELAGIYEVVLALGNLEVGNPLSRPPAVKLPPKSDEQLALSKGLLQTAVVRYIDQPSGQNLATIVERLRELAHQHDGYSWAMVKATQELKAKEKGDFSERIFLIWINLPQRTYR